MRNLIMSIMVSFFCLFLATGLYAADERRGGEKILRYQHDGILVTIRPDKAKVESHISELRLLFAEFGQDIPPPISYDVVNVGGWFKSLNQICQYDNGKCGYRIFNENAPIIVSHDFSENWAMNTLFFVRGKDIEGNKTTRILSCCASKNITLSYNSQSIELILNLELMREAFSKGLCQGLGPHTVQSFFSKAHSAEMRTVLREYLELGVRISEIEIPAVAVEYVSGHNPSLTVYYDPEVYPDAKSLPKSYLILLDANGVSQNFRIDARSFSPAIDE